MATVFRENEDGTYDLWHDGRIKEYDVEEYDFKGAIRRARIQPEVIMIEDTTGYRTRLTR